MKIVLVSACLLGENCKYSGGNNRNEGVLDFCLKAEGEEAQVIPVCPEVMGGLEIPRAPSEIRGGEGADVLAGKAAVVSKTGEDVTKAFLLGAEKALEIACRESEAVAILKANSPSCGCGSIYDGTFSGTKGPGDGVTAALLKKQGIPVYTENNFRILLERNETNHD